MPMWASAISSPMHISTISNRSSRAASAADASKSRDGHQAPGALKKNVGRSTGQAFDHPLVSGFEVSAEHTFSTVMQLAPDLCGKKSNGTARMGFDPPRGSRCSRCCRPHHGVRPISPCHVLRSVDTFTVARTAPPVPHHKTQTWTPFIRFSFYPSVSCGLYGVRERAMVAGKSGAFTVW